MSFFKLSEEDVKALREALRGVEITLSRFPVVTFHELESGPAPADHGEVFTALIPKGEYTEESTTPPADAAEPQREETWRDRPPLL